jgi:pyruvate kinase
MRSCGRYFANYRQHAGRVNLSRAAILAEPRYTLPKNKIVCTIGPNSEIPDVAAQLIDNGLSVARMNFSHGDFAEHRGQMVGVMEGLKKGRPGRHVGYMLDTKGPEIRTGLL